jgi:hypothetical protein
MLAEKLFLEGKSGRQISKIVGKSKSHVNDWLLNSGLRTGKIDQNGFKSPALSDSLKEGNKAFIAQKGPRILLYDVETAPLVAHMWSMWQQGFGLNQIEKDWHLLSFCAKWLGEDEVFYYDQSQAQDIENDYGILLQLWNLLNEADIVVGHNSKKFDTKKVNARFILNGLPKPSTYRQIDTLEIVKRQFGFTSNKLQYLTDSLCSNTKKSQHHKFPGHLLWSECLKGNPEAWAEMKEYNIDDVLSLEELYNLLSSWDNTLPNFDAYVDEILDMSEWEHDGYHYTNFGKYKRYRNKLTGVQRRSRINELSQEKRKSLLANIV